MSQAHLGEHLAKLKSLTQLIGSPEVDQCQICGRPADRMVCHACREEREAQYARQCAEFDRDIRRVVRHVKDAGELNDLDRRWLLANGCADTVKAFEEKFRNDKRGGTMSRRKAADAGFGGRP